MGPGGLSRRSPGEGLRRVAALRLSRFYARRAPRFKRIKVTVALVHASVATTLSIASALINAPASRWLSTSSRRSSAGFKVTLSSMRGQSHRTPRGGRFLRTSTRRPCSLDKGCKELLRSVAPINGDVLYSGRRPTASRGLETLKPISGVRLAILAVPVVAVTGLGPAASVRAQVPTFPDCNTPSSSTGLGVLNTPQSVDLKGVPYLSTAVSASAANASGGLTHTLQITTTRNPAAAFDDLLACAWDASGQSPPTNADYEVHISNPAVSPDGQYTFSIDVAIPGKVCVRVRLEASDINGSSITDYSNQASAMAAVCSDPSIPRADIGAASGDGCNPGGHQNYRALSFDGWNRRPPSTPGGVYANIWNYSPWVSRFNGSSDKSVVAAWVMLANGPYYAQIGWLEYPGGTRHTFEQVNGPSTSQPVTNFDPTYGVNSYTYYTVLYGNAGSGVYSFRYAGNTSKFQFLGGFAPLEGQNYGETQSNADQMPGGHESYYWYETMTDVNIWIGGWQAFNGNYSTGGTPYGGYKAGAKEIDIYDTRCPH